jgi:hypothetical protein
MTQVTRISLSVTSEDAETIVRATDHMARTASGLALDGMNCIVFVGPEDDEDERGTE